MADIALILTWIQTVATVFGLAGVLVAVYTLLQSLNQSIMTSIGQISFSAKSMGYFVVKSPGILGLLFGNKPELRRLPTIACLVRAGDNKVYTSAIFDQAPPSSTTVCWVNLYTQFFNQVALHQQSNSQPSLLHIGIKFEGMESVSDILSRAGSNVQKMKERLKDVRNVENSQDVQDDGDPRVVSAWDSRMRKFSLASSRSQTQNWDEESLLPGEELTQDLRLEKESLYASVQRYWLYDNRKLVNCVLKLDDYNKLKTALSKHARAQKFSSADNFQRLITVDQKPCIEVSREELAGLALSLGMCLTVREHNSIEGIGPFGIYISGHRIDMQWRLHISHQHRQADRPTKGSGYSILFAKHMACGSLPFQQSKGLIHCVCVNHAVLHSILKGEHLNIYKRDRHPISLNYLIHLPAVSQLCIYGESYRTLQNPGNKELPLGSIFDITPKDDISAPREPVSTWPKVVARIAFGGLVPQANNTLVDAVQFTVGTRINPCGPECNPGDPCINLVNALAQLRSIMDHKAPTLNLFGALGRHEILDDSLGSPESTVSETNCLAVSNCRHTGALFARYMTLFERLVAVSSYSVGEVYDKCCEIVEIAYQRAVEKEFKEIEARKTREDERQKEGKDSTIQVFCLTPGREDEDDLAKIVNNVEAKIKDEETVTVEDCANVARCIIAAWAWRVRKIRDLEWREGDSEHMPPTFGRPELDRSAAMADLPSVLALGIL
jgi:hypothetical protein